MNTDVKIIDTEKMLTRVFKENDAEKNPGVEKVLSVISKDTAHLPGSVINNNDIMYNPGQQVLTIKKVGDNIISITPYSVFVNHGGANAHNTKEYKLNYSMIGDKHNFCTNNVDTIMHVATGNNVVLFIIIKDNSIEEVNVTPCPDASIYNCCSIYHYNKVSWWIFTSNGIYYLQPTLTLKDTWSNSSYSLSSKFEYTSGKEPVVTWHFHESNSTYDGWFGITLLNEETHGLITVMTNKQNEDGGCFVPDGTTFINTTNSDVQIYDISSYEYSIGSSISSADFRYLIAAGNWSGKVELLIYSLTDSKGIGTPMTKKTDTDIENLNYKLFPKNYIIDYTSSESDSGYYDSCELWTNIADSQEIIVYNIHFYFSSSNNEENSFIWGLVKDRTILLLDTNFKLFNLEPLTCFYMTRNGHGDERSTTYKAIYYINSGELEFYTGSRKTCGMFYTYRDTVYNDTTSSLYLIRSKVDVTQAFEFDNVDNEFFKEYTGNASTTGGAEEYTKTFPVSETQTEWTEYPDILVIKTDSGHEIVIFPNGGNGTDGLIFYNFFDTNGIGDNKLKIEKGIKVVEETTYYIITVTANSNITINVKDNSYYYFYKRFNEGTGRLDGTENRI